MRGKELRFAKLSVQTIDGAVSQVILNGTDISKQCRKVVFTHEAGHRPTVQLELFVEECTCRTLGSAMVQPIKPEYKI
jgi:hypothetical protein